MLAALFVICEQSPINRETPMSLHHCRAGTPHPLSPAFFMDSAAFQDFCAAHHPFGCKTAEEAEEQLAYSRQQLATARKSLAWFTAQGDLGNVRRLKATVRDHSKAVRNGEVYFRALNAEIAA
jgi:hypothetical protein